MVDSPTKRKAPLPAPFGKYTLLRELGRGGKGVVYEALDSVLNRHCALKMTIVQPGVDPAELEKEGERFLVEARLSANLPKHPHLVSVYEAGVIDGKRYLAAELVAGQPMTRWRKSAAPALPAQIALLRDVALAVDHAHRHGVVHRDLKPQNILVDGEGRPHVTDFGLAKVLGSSHDPSKTDANKVWGTPPYMSPEQCRGLDTLDQRADVYSLGAMLYEILAGRPPFAGAPAEQLMEKTVREAIPPISAVVRPEAMSPLHRALEGPCMRALSKDPAGRPASARAFADELGRGVESGPAPSKGFPIWIAATAAALLVGTVAAIRFLGGGSGEENSALQEAERKKVEQQFAVEKKRAADDARREAEEKARQREEEFRRDAEARRRAEEEAATAAKVQQIKAEEDRRAAEERARAAELAAKKAQDQLANKPLETPAPTPAPTEKPATPPADPTTTKPPPGTPAPSPTPSPAPAPGPNALRQPAAAPPTGEPKTLEGNVLHFEAEDFTGGEKAVAGQDYSDSTPGNSGRTYRTSDVDIEAFDGRIYVTDTNPGEWLNYRFQGGGRYGVEIQYISRNGATVHVEVDGENVTGPIALPPSADQRTWTTFSTTTRAVPQGTHAIHLVFDTRLYMVDSFSLKPYTALPVPEAARLAAAEKTIKELFKVDYAKRSPADQQALAKKLLAQAAQSADDPVARYVLLDEAREVAAQAGDITTTLAAITELEKSYAVDVAALRGAALASAAKSARTPEAAKAVVEAYLDLADQAADGDEYEAALGHLSKAESVAKSAQSSSLLARVQARGKEVAALRDEFKSLKAAIKTLEEKPDDPAANAAVGLFRCFSKGQWSLGVPLLVKGSDAAVAAAAQKELPPPADAATQTALADAWREVGEKKTGTLKEKLFTRALYWYEKALPGTTGLARVKVDQQIEALYKAIPGSDAFRKSLVFWVEPAKDPSNAYREHIFGARVQNNKVTTAEGGRALSLANRSSLEYPALDAVKAMDRTGAVFAWVKPDKDGNWQAIVERGDDNRQTIDFGLYLYGGSPNVRCNWPEAKGGDRHQSKGSVPPGQWSLVGFTWDDTGGKFYIDGREEGAFTHAKDGLPQRRAGKIYVGADPVNGPGNFNGLIGSVMIYSRELTAAEVTHLYMGTRSRFR